MVKTQQKIQSDPSKKMLSPSPTSLLKKFKGVRMRSWGSWVSEIRAPNQKTRIWLGSYSTPEAAARAYDAALLCLKGTSASFNFPITSSSHYIPSDKTMSPKSIQRLAAAAAAAVSSPPPDSSPSSIPSSPSIYDQIDDDVSLIPSNGSTTSCCYNIEPMSIADSWFNFDDQSFNAAASLFNPAPMVDDFSFEGDFSLWSFAD